jgi:hypothetical protein
MTSIRLKQKKKIVTNSSEKQFEVFFAEKIKKLTKRFFFQQAAVLTESDFGHTFSADS